MREKWANAFEGVSCFTRWGVLLAMLAWMTAGPAAAPAADSATAAGAVKVNREVPRVESPKGPLEFSANPTPDEIFRAHVFPEPLVVVGSRPAPAENAALAAALVRYSRRSGPDDFSGLTDFLMQHPQSPWSAALLTDLGFEYYNTAHYAAAMAAWSQAWALAKNVTDRKGLALVDRAFGELIYMDARLGRMEELEALLKSVEKQPLVGPAAGRAVEAREALWNMQNRPEISFRCGPLALRSIRMALRLDGSSDAEILKSASTQKGCSLPQVAELSRKIGLNYQMAFRNEGEFVTPSVVHWKVGHYAALVRKEGNLYQLQDPTFGNETWATKEALETETSGYFLVAGGSLPAGWRAVGEKEGATIWGKGLTGANDSQHIAQNDLATDESCPAQGVGMAVAKVHLMDVNLDLTDQPVGYEPPVGPAVRCVIRYNQRDLFQPGNFSYGNLGPLWTSDWFTYITDNPSNLLANVNLYVGGGGQRTFIGFNTNTQTYAFQQYDQTLLRRTGPASYELLSGNGSKLVFTQSDGGIGSARNIFLTQKIDAQGNANTFTYDTNFCLVAVTDAIGQVTTLTYGLDSVIIGTGPDEVIVPADKYKLTKVTDPFGRSATFNYKPQVVEIGYTYFNGQVSSISYDYAWGLDNITDVVGITSQFGYQAYDTPVNQFQTFVTSYVNSLTTPYGTTTFFGGDNGNSRSMEITYPDGGKERVEYSQTNTNQPLTDPGASVPTGMSTVNSYLRFRDTYYWDRTACALGYGDYSKARLYHFLHTENLAATAGALESVKAPLEGRVWYDYAGQTSPIILTSNTQPAHIGRVLDDGSTQLYTFGYNPFGNVTSSMDPLGRTFSYIYDTNGIDLLEIRQTRAGNNELFFKAIYDSRHRPLTITDAAGQTTTRTYNARGQLLTATNPKNETITITYDANGRLLAMDGPLPGSNDVITATYDAVGRTRSFTDVSGYTVIFDYDNLDRTTRLTYPDGTFVQILHDRLDCSAIQDRAGRQTHFVHDNMRQLTERIDALGRVTRFEWCRCGSPKSLTDPMGRTTSWTTDLQGRRIAKRYADGSQVSYLYENMNGRLRQLIDEKGQTTFYTYNLDNSLRSRSHGDTMAPTPDVSFVYDPNYQRLTGMTDGIGTTTYRYIPLSGGPVLGAGRLAGVTGPLAGDSVSYGYDELGRVASRSINGVAQSWARDPLGRVTNTVDALGGFACDYVGASGRVAGVAFPGGQTSHLDYFGPADDNRLQQITHRKADASLISQFTYAYNVTGDITTWAQQLGSFNETWTAAYDAADRLTNVLANLGGTNLVSTSYAYDEADNRLVENVNGVPTNSQFNVLNQLVFSPGANPTQTTYEWDGLHHLTAINRGAARSEFAYDGWGRLRMVTEKSGGATVSQRRFVWCGREICEERDENNSVVNRFFQQGEQRQGANYYYFSDHLGSVRELVDGSSAVRAEYSYSPFGAKVRRQGDLDSNRGFTDLLDHQPSATLFALHRVYDPGSARWLSRDPLEESAGLNVYAYVHNDPLDRTDPTGLDDVLSTSPGGLGPQLNLNLGGLSLQLQAPWSYPGSSYSAFDVTLNLNLTPNVALLCDASIGGLGVDVKNIGPFEFQTTLTGLKSGQEQVTIDTGNPKIGLQAQFNWGPDGSAITFGAGGTFP